MGVILSNHWLLYVYIFQSFLFPQPFCIQISTLYGVLVMDLWLVLLSPNYAPLPLPCFGLGMWHLAHSTQLSPSVRMAFGTWGSILFLFLISTSRKAFLFGSLHSSSVEQPSADVRQPGTSARLWGDRWGNGVENVSTWSRIAQLVNSNMSIWTHMCPNEAGQQADKQHTQIILM